MKWVNFKRMDGFMEVWKDFKVTKHKYLNFELSSRITFHLKLKLPPSIRQRKAHMKKHKTKASNLIGRLSLNKIFRVNRCKFEKDSVSVYLVKWKNSMSFKQNLRTLYTKCQNYCLKKKKTPPLMPQIWYYIPKGGISAEISITD